MAPSHIREKMESTGPISDRAAQHGKFAGRRNRALLNRCVATSPLNDCGSHVSPCRLVVEFIHQCEQIWMNNVAVVEIGVILRAVAVRAVPEIPRLVFLKRIVNSRTLPSCAEP